MKKRTLKQLYNEIENILLDNGISLEGSALQVSANLQKGHKSENLELWFSARYTPERDDDKNVFSCGNTPDELIFDFIKDLQIFTGKTIVEPLASDIIIE